MTDINLSRCRNLPRAEQIIVEVCERHGVARRELLSPRRYEYLSGAKKECWKMMRTAKMSYREIGRICNRHESSIRKALGLSGKESTLGGQPERPLD